MTSDNQEKNLENNKKENGPETLTEKQRVGDYLKSMRVKQNKALEQVSQKTKILTTILKDLEDNNLVALPGKTYVRGFAKSYAKEIGADVSKTLLLLDELYLKGPLAEGVHEQNPRDIIHKLDKDICDLPHEQKRNPHVSPKLPLAIIGSIILLVVPIFYAIKFLQNPNALTTLKNRLGQFNSPKGPVPSSPVETAPQEAEEIAEITLPVPPDPIVAVIEQTATPTNFSTEKETPTKKVEEATEPKASEVIPVPVPVPVPVAVEKTAEKSEPETLTIPKGEILEVSYRPITTPLYSVIKESKEISDPEIFPPHIKARMNNSKQNIFINAVNDSTWITYKKDGDPIKTFTIEKGKTLFIQGDEVLLFMGNANATKVFYNNKHIDLNAPTGVKSLVFPETSASNHYLPLFIRQNGKVFTSNEYKTLSEQMKNSN